MKKIQTMRLFSVISLAIAMLCGMIFTGCVIAEDFIAPKDKWVWKESKNSENSFKYTYKSGETDKTINFDLYVNYATKKSTITFNKSVTKDIEPGLNAILVPASDANSKNNFAEIFSDAAGIKDVCVFKSFGTKSTASKDNSTEEKNINLESIWTLVYNFNNFETYSTKAMSDVAKNLTLCDEDTANTFNWKRILYNMIGDSLFNN